MKYRLNPLISVSQNLVLQRWVDPQKKKRKTEYVRLEPGKEYTKYSDDELYVESLRRWTIKLRRTDALEDALKSKGIKYTLKKGCSCSGGKMNIIFPGIEVLE